MSFDETAAKDRGTVLAENRTDLAVQRTLIAGERTLMAWIRTAISMIGFGFTICKFFQYMPGEISARNVLHPQAARNMGLTLVALGSLALLAAAWQHWNFLKEIGEMRVRQVWSISFVVAIAVIFIGFLAFCGILLRRGPF